MTTCSRRGSSLADNPLAAALGHRDPHAWRAGEGGGALRPIEPPLGLDSA